MCDIQNGQTDQDSATLKGDLQRNPDTPRIASSHPPIFSSAPENRQNRLLRLWALLWRSVMPCFSELLMVFWERFFTDFERWKKGAWIFPVFMLGHDGCHVPRSKRWFSTRLTLDAWGRLSYAWVDGMARTAWKLAELGMKRPDIKLLHAIEGVESWRSCNLLSPPAAVDINVIGHLNIIEYHCKKVSKYPKLCIISIYIYTYALFFLQGWQTWYRYYINVWIYESTLLPRFFLLGAHVNFPTCEASKSRLQPHPGCSELHQQQGGAALRIYRWVQGGLTAVKSRGWLDPDVMNFKMVRIGSGVLVELDIVGLSGPSELWRWKIVEQVARNSESSFATRWRANLAFGVVVGWDLKSPMPKGQHVLW